MRGLQYPVQMGHRTHHPHQLVFGIIGVNPHAVVLQITVKVVGDDLLALGHEPKGQFYADQVRPAGAATGIRGIDGRLANGGTSAVVRLEPAGPGPVQFCNLLGGLAQDRQIVGRCRGAGDIHPVVFPLGVLVEGIDRVIILRASFDHLQLYKGKVLTPFPPRRERKRSQRGSR